MFCRSRLPKLLGITVGAAITLAPALTFAQTQTANAASPVVINFWAGRITPVPVLHRCSTGPIPTYA